jgi:metal-responsive CopG/Arc/MetJ family transcriptional regulator
MYELWIRTRKLQDEEEDFNNVSLNVLARIDKLAGSKRSRSVVIERAIRNELRQQSSSVDEVYELELINNAADQLNIEAADVLEYV